MVNRNELRIRGMDKNKLNQSQGETRICVG